MALLDALLWLLVVVIRAISVHGTELSSFELERRMKAGDSEAEALGGRQALLPRILGLKLVVEGVVLVAATLTSVLTYGWLIGSLAAIVLVICISALSRIPLISRLANELYGRFEPDVLKLTGSLSWLDLLRGFTATISDFHASSKADLVAAIGRSKDVISHDEFLRLSAALELEDKSVTDVMTPASVIDTADVHDTLGPLVLDDLHKTGHSRFPVIDGDIHHIVGVLYLRDAANLRNNKPSVKEAMDPRVHYIREDQTLEHALHGFLRTHRHLFVVVNAYRETVGILTLEDVLEALLGRPIVDEFDQFEDLRAVAERNPRKNNLPKGKTDI